MKRRRVKNLEGEEVVIYYPETERDLAILQKMKEEGTIDTRLSFADEAEDEGEEEAIKKLKRRRKRRS